METRHWWNAPTIPPTTPAGASVVVRTACGDRTMTLPVWQVREWDAAEHSHVTMAGDCDRCRRAQ